MPQGLGKTGSNAVDTPSATHSEIFQYEDKVPGQRSKISVKDFSQQISAAAYHSGVALIN